MGNYLNSLDYSNLEQLIHQYSKRLSYRPFNANTFLTITKPTPENLKKYSNTYQKIVSENLPPKFLDISSRIQLVFHISWMSLTHLVISLFTSFEWIKFNQRLRMKDVHFLILEILPTLEKDRELYSPYPSTLKSAKSEQNTLQIILNGTRLPWLYIKTILPKNGARFLILPKTLNPIETFKILKLNCLSVLKVLQSTSKLDNNEKIFRIDLIKNQFSRSTIANQTLEYYLLRILDNSPETESTLLTVEGHAHEKIWIECVKKLNREIKINLYQHAPILTNQLSFYENIELLSNTDVIHFTGHYPANLVSDWFKFHNRLSLPAFSIAGSDKFIEASPESRRNLSAVLFLPEGTLDATLELLELFSNIKELWPDLKMIFRLHPSLRKSRRVKQILRAMGIQTQQLSSNSLLSDLSASFCSIYRGSAASIQGLALGVIPIHFSREVSLNLDPIPQNQIAHPVCHTHEEIAAVLDTLINGRFELNLDFISEMARFSNDYFSDPRLK